MMNGLVDIREPGADDPSTFTYEICGFDRIVAVRSGRCGASTSPMLNRRLWDHLHDGNVTDVYRALVRLVRRERRAVRFRFRCDEPDVRRDLTMTMEPLDGGGIRFTSRPVMEAPQSPTEFYRRHCRPPVNVEVCELCGSIKAGAHWLPADQGLEKLGLFADDLEFRTWPAGCTQCRTADH
jgi:hypothetical protein